MDPILIAIVLGAYVLAVIFGLALCKAAGGATAQAASRSVPPAASDSRVGGH